MPVVVVGRLVGSSAAAANRTTRAGATTAHTNHAWRRAVPKSLLVACFAIQEEEEEERGDGGACPHTHRHPHQPRPCTRPSSRVPPPRPGRPTPGDRHKVSEAGRGRGGGLVWLFLRARTDRGPTQQDRGPPHKPEGGGGGRPRKQSGPDEGRRRARPPGVDEPRGEGSR